MTEDEKYIIKQEETILEVSFLGLIFLAILSVSAVGLALFLVFIGGW